MTEHPTHEGGILVGRIAGVCATRCKYDIDGVCTVCSSLDPSEYVVWRLPTEETARAEAIKGDFADVAAKHGLDPSILQVRRG